MLTNPEERVRLLKKGIESKAIEEIYIRSNGLRIVKEPVLFDFIKTTMMNYKNSSDSLATELKQTYQNKDIKVNRICIPVKAY